MLHLRKWPSNSIRWGSSCNFLSSHLFTRINWNRLVCGPQLLIWWMLSSFKSTRSSLLSPGQPGITVLLSCCRTCQVPSADSWHSKVHRLTHYTKGTMLVAVVNRNDILPPFCKIHMCQKVGYIPHRNSGACLLGDTSRGLVMWHLSISLHGCGKISSSDCFQ